MGWNPGSRTLLGEWVRYRADLEWKPSRKKRLRSPSPIQSKGHIKLSACWTPTVPQNLEKVP